MPPRPNKRGLEKSLVRGDDIVCLIVDVFLGFVRASDNGAIIWQK
jgi:hypothetical protein